MSPKAKNKGYDKKIFRLLYILNKLDAGVKVSTRQLAEEFNVTLRTVQRNLELLNMAGFPLISLEKGFHSFIEGFSLKKIMTTKEEASLLSLLYEITRSLGKNFEDSFWRILQKTLAEDIESPFYVKIPEGVKLNKEFPYLMELKLAIEECRKIEMLYLTEGKEKHFRLDPLKIIFFDGFWHLLSRVTGKDWMFKFRLENIKRLKVLDDCFEVPKNLGIVLAQSVNIWFSEKRDNKVVVKVDKIAAGYFKQRAYLPLQKIKEEHKDGSLTIETRLSQSEEIIPIIFKWIPHIKVVEPKKLQEEIRGIVEGYLKAI
jgi:predicted DNA-binding transcriptional regulator YafY